ncbi:DUF3040 domain-containing protein [Amycolatopsis sp. PS_44_ISF1]|uniref:DUF3040 domain-containing protein n=1 Tax=Amycolatopsis sp. PS_44_ISF1 TaxID=2974917 RepID=UPI0028E08ACB|nr:DUF3040 domain-containing protein [Amycolatopsis sp. PS_44_ISF1]MDT8912484.1 DUF3040 domain-containing protein [Amycolatopsis sp. PS_44_ISF1]
MLSHHDRRELEKIERWFEASDPELAAALREGRPTRSRRFLTTLLVTFDVTAGVLLVAGLATASPALTLCALLAAAGGVTAHLVRGHHRR